MPPNQKFLSPFNPIQQKVVALVPKFTAVPSILGSLYIIQHVLRSRKRRNRTYHRLLASMSAMDFIYAIKTFLSTWPSPRGSGYGASGTTQTCTAAGFWGHGGSLSSALYSSTLTLYFLLTIAFGWRQESARSIEPFLHLLPLVVGWSTAIASLPLELMNPIGWTCWIGSGPWGCNVNPDVDCSRGKYFMFYRWAFFHAEIWASIVFVSVTMSYIYCKMRANERRVERYEFDGSLSNNFRSTLSHVVVAGSASGQLSMRQQQKRLKLSQRFASQALLYVSMFVVAWIFPMIQFLVAQLAGYYYFPIMVLTVILNPLQGFFNALIYFRPQYIQHRKRNLRLPPLQSVRNAISLDAHDENEDELDHIEADEAVRDLSICLNNPDRPWDDAAEQKQANTVEIETSIHSEEIVFEVCE